MVASVFGIKCSHNLKFLAVVDSEICRKEFSNGNMVHKCAAFVLCNMSTKSEIIMEPASNNNCKNYPRFIFYRSRKFSDLLNTLTQITAASEWMGYSS